MGVGSAAVAVFIEGANVFESGPYPRFFTKRELLPYDLFLAAVIVVGGAFAIATLLLARRSRFPRTDSFGAGLVAMILMLLGGALVFTRLVAVIRGA